MMWAAGSLQDTYQCKQNKETRDRYPRLSCRHAKNMHHAYGCSLDSNNMLVLPFVHGSWSSHSANSNALAQPAWEAGTCDKILRNRNDQLRNRNDQQMYTQQWCARATPKILSTIHNAAKQHTPPIALYQNRYRRQAWPEVPRPA